MSEPKWQEGIPANLEAAAADAGEWLDLIERCVMAGAWHFNAPSSMEKLRACIGQLERHLEESAKEAGK